MNKNVPILLDGPMGTELIRLGVFGPNDLAIGKTSDGFNSSHPEVVRSIHSSYLDAGSQSLFLNTFGLVQVVEWGAPHDVVHDSIREQIQAAARVTTGPLERYRLSLGPFLPSLPVPSEGIARICEVARSLGVGGVALETWRDPVRMAEVVRAIRQRLGRDFSIWALGTFSSGEAARAVAREFARAAEEAGADAAGANCSDGPESVFSALREMMAVSRLPLVAKPNLGSHTSKSWVEAVLEGLKPFPRERILAVGGCCGTGSAEIRGLAGAGELLF